MKVYELRYAGSIVNGSISVSGPTPDEYSDLKKRGNGLLNIEMWMESVFKQRK